jgi:hypothetical protein
MFKVSHIVIPLILSIVFTGLTSNNIAFGQTMQEDVNAESTIQITKVGLELVQSSVSSGELNDAQKYSEFTSGFFGKHYVK